MKLGWLFFKILMVIYAIRLVWVDSVNFLHSVVITSWLVFAFLAILVQYEQGD